MSNVLTCLYRWKYRQYKDTRSWQQRISRLHDNWELLMDGLTNLYLKWRYAPPPPEPPAPPNASKEDTDDYSFTIEAVDLYTLKTSTFIHRTSSSLSPALNLMDAGYIGNSPEKPSLAISLTTLELFLRIRLRKPSFSTEAFAKVICDYYSVRIILLNFADKLIFPHRSPSNEDTATVYPTRLTFILPFTGKLTNT